MANFHLAWPHGQAAAAIAAWQRWAPQGPGELAAGLALAAAGDLAGAPTVEVYGAVLGTRRDADGLLDELTALAGAGPLSRVCAELSCRDTVRSQYEHLPRVATCNNSRAGIRRLGRAAGRHLVATRAKPGICG